MKRAMFLMLAVFIVTISSVYGDIGKGNWTEEEINYFKTKEYVGNYKFYNYDTKWVPPYINIGISENEILGYGSSYSDILSKIIITGKIAEEDEFRYLSLLRNEIYARNGYIFKDAGLQAFFNQMPWYKPTSENVQLNGYERTNIRTIKKIEKEVRDIVGLEEINPDTFPERYKGSVIIEAKWGDAPGEMGYDQSGPGFGPGSFTVDSYGNIYIIDNMHGTVKKYNKKGKLINEYKHRAFYDAQSIIVDKAENIYVKSMDATRNEILKYSMKDKSTKSFWYPLYNTANATYSFNRIGNSMILTKNGKVVFDSGTFDNGGEKSLKTSNIEHMEFQKDWSIKIKDLDGKYKSVEIKIPKIFNKKCKPIGIGRGNYAIYYTYFGRDKENNNIFIGCKYDIMPEFRDSNRHHNTKYIIYKYNNSGVLIAAIELPTEEIDYNGLDFFNQIKIDRDGNVYFLRPDKKGLKIYKYEMR